MKASAALPVEHFAGMDHGRLASLAANQAAEITRLLREKQHAAFALHRRRVEVAYLRLEHGLRLDTECSAAWRKELHDISGTQEPPMCPGRCGCRWREDADRRDCGCNHPDGCCFESWDRLPDGRPRPDAPDDLEAAS